MNNRIGLLAGLLVLQLVLVAIALFKPGSAEEAPDQLLSFDAQAVERITISDGEKQVDITKSDGVWRIAGVAADADKVADTLEKLAAIDAPWPVATSSSSAARFEVSEDNYQRHITLLAGDTVLAELYLGTSPGYQRVHARRADGDEVFSVALSNYELGVDADNWVDKGVLAVAEAPTRIEASLSLADAQPVSHVLLSTDEGWLYDGSAADSDAAATYANRFTTLRVLGLAEEGVEAAEQGRLTLGNEADSRVYVISRVGDEGDYLIALAEDGIRYRIATYIAEQLLMMDADFSPQSDDTEAVEDSVEQSVEQSLVETAGEG